jgi:hypothetical protein
MGIAYIYLPGKLKARGGLRVICGIILRRGLKESGLTEWNSLNFQEIVHTVITVHLYELKLNK